MKNKKFIILFIIILLIIIRNHANAALTTWGTVDGAPISWTSYGNSTYSTVGGVLQSNNTNNYSSSLISNNLYGLGTGDMVYTIEHKCYYTGDGGRSSFGWDPNLGTHPCGFCDIAKTGYHTGQWSGYSGCINSGAHTKSQGFANNPCDNTYKTYKIIIKKNGGHLFSSTIL